MDGTSPTPWMSTPPEGSTCDRGIRGRRHGLGHGHRQVLGQSVVTAGRTAVPPPRGKPDWVERNVTSLVRSLSMRLDRPLDDLFATGSAVRVLRALVGLPKGFGVSAREIGRRGGVSHPTASKVLGALAEQGLVSVRRSTVGDEYVFNGDHVLADPVVDAFELERSILTDLVRFLGDSLRRRVSDVQAAYLFGSAVWGEMVAGSDLDLAIISPVTTWRRAERRMPELAGDVKKRYGNRLTWTVGDPSLLLPGPKWRAPPIWRRILKEGIPVPVRGGSAGAQDG